MEQKQDFMQRFQVRLLNKHENRKNPAPFREELEIFEADPSLGLTQAQVEERIRKGWVSGKPRAAGNSEQEIVFANIFTFFNLVFVVLAVML
ncbi:MAG: hypothetical protein IJN58_05680, partial [Clostridia bacterium]|nr:hypothetical protein [Clostridia bacterium]